MSTLYDAMLADGATLLYKFNEASGNILNSGSTVGSYDFSAVSSNITRQVAGRSGPDALAILGSTSTQGSPTYGHAQVPSRPNLQGNTTFSLELVAMAPSNHDALIVDMDSGDFFTTAAIYIDGPNNALRGSLGTISNPINTAALSTDATTITTTYWHAVITWDGDRHKGYFNGSLVYNNNLTDSGLYNGGGTGVTSKLAVCGAVDQNSLNCAAKVDVLGVYTGHVLTAGEVAAHYALIDVLGGGGAFFFNRYVASRGKS